MKRKIKQADYSTVDYLNHILDAIHQIHQYTDKLTEAAFLKSRFTQDAVVRNIEIIGEAAQNIQRCDPGFTAKHAEVPWREAYRMRNFVSHAYFLVNYTVVWGVVSHDISMLEQQILKIREDLKITPHNTAV